MLVHENATRNERSEELTRLERVLQRQLAERTTLDLAIARTEREIASLRHASVSTTPRELTVTWKNPDTCLHETWIDHASALTLIQMLSKAKPGSSYRIVHSDSRCARVTSGGTRECHAKVQIIERLPAA